jgi:hypothetical protein
MLLFVIMIALLTITVLTFVPQWILAVIGGAVIVALACVVALFMGVGLLGFGCREGHLP